MQKLRWKEGPFTQSPAAGYDETYSPPGRAATHHECVAKSGACERNFLLVVVPKAPPVLCTGRLCSFFEIAIFKLGIPGSTKMNHGSKTLH